MVARSIALAFLVFALSFPVSHAAMAQEPRAVTDEAETAGEDRGQAAEEEQEGIIELEEVVVTATRTPSLLKDVPGSVTVITREQIEATNPQDVGDVLENVAGLKIQRHGSMGSTTSVFIRGLYSPHTLVMVDGRPLNEPSLGTADLSWISTDNIERVEVVRGPTSALYGANAVAGVINIITKAPPEKPTTRIGTSYGRWQTSITRLEHGATLGNFGYLVTGSYKDSDGHRDNSDHESIDTSAKVRYAFSDEASFTLSTGYYDARTGTPGAEPAKDPAIRTTSQRILGNNDVTSLFNHYDRERTSLNAALDVKDLKMKFYSNYWDDDFHLEWIDFSSARNVENDNYKTAVYGGEVQYSRQLLHRNLITAGVTVEQDDFEADQKVRNLSTATTTAMKWDADRTTWAVFLQDEVNLEPVTLTLGGRWDDPDDFDSQFSFRSGLVFDLSGDTTLRALYGESFRAPTLNDLNWPSDPFAQGNPNLEPEEGVAYEMGIEQVLGKNVLAKMSLFRQELDNMIIWAPTGPAGLFGNKWQPTNLNKAEIDGVEFETRVKLAKDKGLNLRYTYLDAKQKSMEIVNSLTNEMRRKTRTLALIPKHKIDLGFECKDVFGFDGLRMNVEAQYVSKTYQYYSNYSAFPAVTMDKKKISGFTTVNLKLTKAFKNGEVFVAADNLFDEEYALQFGPSISDEDYPMPGRSVTGGISITF